jgi:hypothetical protein
MLTMKTVLLLLILAASTANAQVPATRLGDSSTPDLMRRIGPRGDVSVLLYPLRGVGTTWSRSKADEVADSLTNRVIGKRAAPNIDPTAYKSAIQALNVLVFAGSVGTARGTPYSGTFDRLVRVYEKSSVPYFRDRALAAMPRTTDRVRALNFLRAVAVSSDPMAYSAVGALINDTRSNSASGVTAADRDQSRAILIDLAKNHRVVDRKTAQDLQLWIGSQP